MSRRKSRFLALSVSAAVALSGFVYASAHAAAEPGAEALTSLNVSSGNRRAPVSGLYDWSRAG
jgi:hypothetical protein